MNSMKHIVFIIFLTFSVDICSSNELPPMSDTSSCSTILYIQNKSLFVGHNLDTDYEITGLVIVNKRGVSKREISWSDYNSPSGLSKARIHWKSKYGSIVYSGLGKEFIDGGMNETGLYIGEMALVETKYPDNKLPKIIANLWMQYLLDNFKSVEEVIKNLKYIANEGPNPWHYFVSDRKGDAETIEFINGELIVHRKSDMPVLALCNTIYDEELKRLKEYQNYGGQKKLSLKINGNDTRFLYAAKMLNDSSEYNRSEDAADYTFKILRQLYGKDNNRWSIVYDVSKLRMYFNTNNARQIRYVDFKDFDFSDNSPAMILDIRENLEGNVSKYFIQYNDSINKLYIDKLLKACNCEEGINQLSTFFGNSASEIEIKKNTQNTNHNK
jgi:penicillin V acylase-like amidase (Ntn superfamily)